MPLFFKKKKPSDDSKKRLEYQLCRSKEAGADDILDISSCELSEVPSSAFSICKVLQKKVRTAYLSFCLSPQVLDLHENNLTSLPEDMGKLVSLQRDELGRYRSNGLGGIYITVYSTGNRLTELPASVGSLSSLRTLDISDNNITQLPKTLAYIRTLESFTLDAVKMSYPPDSVCTEGTESIQRFLCDELGEEYCPPSQYLLPVLESDCGKQNSDCLDGLEEAWLNKFSDYEKRKEQKQQEKLAFERHLEQKQKEHTQLLLMNTSHKENILNSVRQEQERLEQGVSQQQRAQEAERLLILEKVRQAEDDTTTAMQKMLSDSCAMSLLQKASDSRRQCLVSETYRSMENLDRKFDQMLSLQVLDKSKAIAQILQEVQIMQKAAFQALQLQKDSVHGLIRTQIKLIEGELMQLTKLEIKRRSLDAENLQEVLVDQRTALSDLLQQLLKQRDQREQELRQVLAEMELKSESNQQNYWMIQYQRLLDAKPLSLRMQEAGVERELVNLLCKLSAQHYLPILAHNRVTTEALRHMSASDLKKVCLKMHHFSDNIYLDINLCHITQHNVAMPSPPLTPGTPVTPSAPSPVEGPGSSECVVCMETGSQVIFLPCGHVCCCQVCSDALQNCPLCRSTISQRVRLFHS
uniref:RING-type domain-containing protein n=1 Tax=Sphaeramia orbicularis TaxID=375764 RepID=A0A673BDS1_9TELE